MTYMFFGAKRFNQDPRGWNTDSVTNATDVFAYADAFLPEYRPRFWVPGEQLR